MAPGKAERLDRAAVVTTTRVLAEQEWLTQAELPLLAQAELLLLAQAELLLLAQAELLLLVQAELLLAQAELPRAAGAEAQGAQARPHAWVFYSRIFNIPWGCGSGNPRSTLQRR